MDTMTQNTDKQNKLQLIQYDVNVNLPTKCF